MDVAQILKGPLLQGIFNQSINQSNLFKVDPKNTASCIVTTNKRFVLLIKIGYTKSLFTIL